MQTVKVTKQPLLQCKFCSKFYPPEFKQTLTTHVQYHIEQSEHQQPGNHKCPWNPPKRGKGDTCNQRFLTAELMAIHTIECHTKTRYTPITSRRYAEAYEEGQREKNHLTFLLSKQENTPRRLFFPKPNINEQNQQI